MIERIVATGASILISTASISGFASQLLAKAGVLAFHNVNHVIKDHIHLSSFAYLLNLLGVVC
jgi:hypothetical protein